MKCNKRAVRIENKNTRKRNIFNENESTQSYKKRNDVRCKTEKNLKYKNIIF